MLRLLLIPALLGYYLAYVLYVRRSTAFFPAVLVSLSALAVYVSGLLGSLMPGVLAVTAAGCVLLAISVWRLLRHPGELGTVRASVLSVETLFLLVSVCAAYFITRDSLLSHWDDFSHWYRICKLLNADNTLPTQPDIKYPTYVPGAACWIYFITRFIGFTQDKCIFAQSLMNIAFCMPLFSAVPKNAPKGVRRLGAAVVCMTAVMIYGMYVSIFSLLVDVLVAVVPMSAILIMSDNADDRWTLPLTLVLSCFGALMKTSGLLFCLFVACAYAYGRRGQKGYAVRAGLLFALPLCMMAGYQIRAKAVFANLSNTAQAMSLERYAGIIGARSLDDVLMVTIRYIKSVFLLHTACDQVILFWVFLAALIAVWAVLSMLGEAQSAKNTGRAITACTAAAAAYNLGLLGTYLFSMSAEEANLAFLACFGRYFGTCAIFVSCLIVAYLLRLFCALPVKQHRLPALALLAMLVFFCMSCLSHSGYIFGWLFDDPYETEYRDYFNQDVLYTIPEQKRYNENRYVILMECDEARYGGNLFCAEDIAQTHLRSNDVFCCDVDRLLSGKLTEAEMNRILSCDRLYLMNEALEEQVRAVLPLSEKLSDTAEYSIVRDE